MRVYKCEYTNIYYIYNSQYQVNDAQFSSVEQIAVLDNVRLEIIITK